MSKIRLVVMDMDGTLLLDNGQGIPQPNIDALRAAHAAGVELALCSGRIPDDMSFYAADMGLPMHILALNGCCSLDRPLGNITRSDYLPVKTAMAIFRMMQEYPVAYGLFGDHDMAVSPTGISDEELLLFFGHNIVRPGSRTRITRTHEDALALIRRGVNKLMIFTGEDGSPLAALKARMEQELPDVEVSSSWVNNLEVNPRGVNKGLALRELSQRLSIPMEEIMAIGDNDNDLPMLEAAGVSVAMGNATPAALAAADYVTLSNKDCGVSTAIRALVLGEDIPGIRRL